MPWVACGSLQTAVQFARAFSGGGGGPAREAEFWAPALALHTKSHSFLM